MLGGFLKGMNDSIKSNRGLVKNRISLKEIYRQETKKAPAEYNVADVRERVKLHLKRQRKLLIISKIKTIAILLIVIWGIYFVAQIFSMPQDKPVKKPSFFKTVFYKLPNGEELKV